MSHHPYYSPSSLKQRKQCPGSAVLCADIEDVGGPAARFGTVTHWISAYCLENKMTVAEYREVFGYSHACEEEGKVLDDVVVDDRMFAMVDYYLAYAHRRMQNAMLHWVEERVHFGRYFGVDPEASGTADLMLVEDGLLEVVDLKTGRMEVDPVNNLQLGSYGIGALEIVRQVCDVDRVRLTIVQPPLDAIQSWELPVDEFEAWARENIGPTVEEIDHAVGDSKLIGDSEATRAAWNRRYLHPSTDACHFCSAKNICPALAAEVNEAAEAAGELADLAGVAGEDLGVMPADRLDKLLRAAPRIESFLRDLRGECERRLLSGEEVPRWKLVQGRQGAREWSDAKAVELMLKKTFRLKDSEAYTQKLISPAQAEKILKKSPARWNKLQGLITRGEGQISIAPEEDERPAYMVASGADAFDVFDAVTDEA